MTRSSKLRLPQGVCDAYLVKRLGAGAYEINKEYEVLSKAG
jgi:hypothetical protein